MIKYEDAIDKMVVDCNDNKIGDTISVNGPWSIDIWELREISSGKEVWYLVGRW